MVEIGGDRMRRVAPSLPRGASDTMWDRASQFEGVARRREDLDGGRAAASSSDVPGTHSSTISRRTSVGDPWRGCADVRRAGDALAGSRAVFRAS